MKEEAKQKEPSSDPAGRSNWLQLKNRTPLNKGNSRLVFEHPDNPDQIVKVLRPDLMETRYGSGAPWRKRCRRYGRFRSYVREIQEYLAVYAKEDHAPPFLQTVIGLVETDLGLGLVTNAARDKDGSLAPNIAMLISAGRFDSTVRRDLELFYQNIRGCDVVISDMNVGNLVYAFDETYGYHFVLIDGLGNANMLPLKTLSRTINRRSKRKRYERLYKRITTRLQDAGYPMPPFPSDS
jgi:hypothetical protein